jgi:hypothetical protein
MQRLLAVLMFIFSSCSDNIESDEWVLAETVFDWHMDWPMSFESSTPEMMESIGSTCFFVLGSPHPDFAEQCEEWDNCDEYWARCDAYTWRDSFSKLERADVDFYIRARAARFLEDNSNVRHMPIARRNPWEQCEDGECPSGFECTFRDLCVPVNKDPCEQLCERAADCYGETKDCELKCEKMFDGPCENGACPVSASSKHSYVDRLEWLECDEIKKWDALRLPFTQEIGIEVFLNGGQVGQCTREEQVILQQRESWLSHVSTDEARSLYNECSEFSVCETKMNCLRERGLVE